MFESAFQDGVKRPGTREMTVMLAGLMALRTSVGRFVSLKRMTGS